jgi:glucose/mannose transport system substrate-binding protein
LWANTAVLSAAGLDPTAEYDTVDDWIAAMDAVRASGHVPLALGATWTQVHLLEVVLLSRLGPTAYAGLWDGSTDARSPAVASAVGDFARLLGFTNADRTALDWEDTAELVADGDAAFTVMGDWAEPALSAPVVWAPFPGTDGVVDLVVDTFAMPVGAEHPAGAQAWLMTCTEIDTQVALTAVKGAAPARGDVPVSMLATYQRTAYAAFMDDTLVPSLTHGMATSPEVLSRISSVVDEVAAGTASTSQVQAALAAAAP